MLRAPFKPPKAARDPQRLPSGQLKRRVLLAKLVQLQARRGERGLTLLVALVAAVVIVSAAASLASRTLSTQLGSSHLSESREAREAAEAGMATVIGELNRERNRQLLTAAVAMTAWSSPSNEAVLTNVCSNTTDPTPDPGTLALGRGTPQPVAGSNGKLQFTLISLEVSSADRSGSFRSSSNGTVTNTSYNPRLIHPDDPQGFGYLRLEVKGEAMNGAGAVISSTTLLRDFKLIPKSCRRSPAPPFGNEVRASLMRPLIVGFNGGGFTTISNGIKIDPSLEQAVCLIQPNASKCGGSNPTEVDRKPVLPMPMGSLLNEWLPADRRYPCPGAASTCTTSTVVTSTSQNYIGINGAKKPRIGKLAIPKNTTAETYPIASDPNNKISTGGIEPNCIPLPEPPPSTETGFHCRLKSVTLEGDNDLYIDTSNGPIYLYLNNSWSASPISYNPTSPSNTLSIIHTYCNPAPTGNSVCTKPSYPDSNPTGARPIRAMIFTDIAGTLDLSSDQSINGFFLWAPLLNVAVSNANKNPAFTGALWVNDLGLGPGSWLSFWPDLRQPTGSSTPGTAFPKFPTKAGQPPSPFLLGYDVVARPCSSSDCIRGSSR